MEKAYLIPDEVCIVSRACSSLKRENIFFSIFLLKEKEDIKKYYRILQKVKLEQVSRGHLNQQILKSPKDRSSKLSP